MYINLHFHCIFVVFLPSQTPLPRGLGLLAGGPSPPLWASGPPAGGSGWSGARAALGHCRRCGAGGRGGAWEGKNIAKNTYSNRKLLYIPLINTLVLILIFFN